MADSVLMGFAHGTEHALFRAVMAELAAFRESAVQSAVTAETNEERCRALGQVELCDDLAQKFVANVDAAIREANRTQAEEAPAP